MKYLVFADLHGSLAGLRLLQKAVVLEKPDVLLCLGDILFGAYDGEPAKCADYLAHEAPTVIGVLGNCDHIYDERALNVSLPMEQVLYFHGHRLIMRHAPFWSEFQPGDIAMYGHTHLKTLSKSRGVITLNPGSIGKPRDGEPGYAIIDDNGVSLKNALTLELISFEGF